MAYAVYDFNKSANIIKSDSADAFFALKSGY